MLHDASPFPQKSHIDPPGFRPHGTECIQVCRTVTYCKCSGIHLLRTSKYSRSVNTSSARTFEADDRRARATMQSHVIAVVKFKDMSQMNSHINRQLSYRFSLTYVHEVNISVPSEQEYSAGQLLRQAPIVQLQLENNCKIPIHPQ